jgi:tubulin delta
MSVVTVQVGQCGNQLGETLLEVLFEQSCGGGGAAAALGRAAGGEDERTFARLARARQRREAFFRPNAELDDAEELEWLEARDKPPAMQSGSARRRSGGSGAAATTAASAAAPSSGARAAEWAQRTARAVLVDMEPRVIDECLRGSRRRRWRYDPSASLRLEGGSGNNWAQGFCSHGPRVRERLVDLVRREVERCDALDAFAVLQSAAGGTGSGLGSFLTCELRDEFPSAARLNVLVWPLSSGEVVVQNYNAALTTAALQESSDAALCLFNDQARYVCQRHEKVERPGLADLNRVLSRELASSLLLPATPAAGQRSAPAQGSVSGALRFLCEHPALRMITSCTVPQMAPDAVAFSSHSWPALLKQASLEQQRLAAYAYSGGGGGDQPAPELGAGAHHLRDVAVARLYTLRGQGAGEAALAALSADGAQAGAARAAATATATATATRSEEQPRTLYGQDKSLSVLSNSQAVVAPLETVAAKGQRMLSTGAYVHQYAQHGLHPDELRACFVQLEQVLADYKALSGSAPATRPGHVHFPLDS